MKERRRNPVRLQIRVIIYILIIAALFLIRGRPDVRDLLRQATGGAAADTVLIVSGADQAPALMDRLLADYRRDYPRLRIVVRGGGSAQALEDLINGRAGAAVMSRPPLAGEQKLFAAARGDTVVWHPIALGAIVVVGAAGVPDTSVELETLRRLAGGGSGGDAPRLYAPDPNHGLWDALRQRLELPPDPGEQAPPGVVFLADEQAVAEAVRAEPGAIGVVSSFALGADPGAAGLRALAVAAAGGGAPARPLSEEIASGAYPLWHYLHIGCRGRGGIQASKFVTHLTSPRGQRQIERTEFLPARVLPREILLDRRPPG